MSGGTVGGIASGPGEPTVSPASGPRRTRDVRAFAEPVEAWIQAGVEGWWRVRLEGVPAAPLRSDDGKAAARAREDRRRALTRIRNAWMRELDRRRDAGELSGQFVSKVETDSDGTEWFVWGPS